MNTAFTPTARRMLPIAFLGLLWALITGGDSGSWIVGLPTVGLAFLAYDRMRTHHRVDLSPSRLPAFVAWFLWQSLRGGADVALRALLPRTSLNPAFVRYQLTIPQGPARVFLINCLSLLPGTLSADLQGDDLLLHALDAESDVIAETHAAEVQVARLFRIERVSHQ